MTFGQFECHNNEISQNSLIMIFLIISMASLVLIVSFFFIDSYFSMMRNQENLESISSYETDENVDYKDFENYSNRLKNWKLEKNLETLKYLNKLEKDYKSIRLPNHTFEKYKEAKYDLRANTVDYCNELKNENL